MPAKKAIFNGHVQGVGFRYTVKRIASGYEVVGTVRNLEDGRVEVQAHSHDPAEVDAFIEDIKTSCLGGNIKDAEIHDISDLADVKGFSIIE
ncbi:acylphosphatase [Phragmitibacter flavus]|uniref:acylphosphatase n=1 Tax=Phragmitibacter flavus TaxID=2576071 RepID=A0A5R8KGL5_9BACT|nr:acylphosphatase [Phragmitibacter flavus]TLD71430.1 acylphosphatase [Phragmitibacter flavus]